MHSSLLSYIQSSSDKFILASCLQKSIRIGYEQAASECAKRLWQIDKSYLMYRLRVIAFEDIALANKDLMSQELVQKWGVREFASKQIDPLAYFSSLSVKMAKSAKDRTSCDLLFLTANKESLKNYSISAELEKKIQKNQEICLALGSKRFNVLPEISADSKDEKLEDNVKALQVYCEEHNCCFNDQDIAKFYATQATPFFLSSLALGCSDKEEKQISSYTSEENFSFSQHCLSFIDGHTKDGSTILFKYFKLHESDICALLPISVTSDQHRLRLILKICLFRLEGQQVNLQLKYPLSQEIQTLAQRIEFELLCPGVSWSNYIKLAKHMKMNMDYINSQRSNLICSVASIAKESSVSQEISKIRA